MLLWLVRDGPIHRLVLFRAPPRAESHGCTEIQLASRIAGLAAATINQRLAYGKGDSPMKLRIGAAESRTGCRNPARIGVKQLSQRVGNWLTLEESESLLEKSDGETLRNNREHGHDLYSSGVVAYVEQRWRR
jgi:hypothetical protein